MLENWTSYVGVAALFTFLGITVKQIVPWKKADADGEAHFRADLIRRVENLEHALERAQAQKQRMEVRHRAELALSNHQFRNITACFDAMLLMLEMSPDRGHEIVVKIKEMRANQLVAEASEKAIIRAAEIEAEAKLEVEENEALYEYTVTPPETQ